MKILALETSSELCSVALSINNDIKVREQLAPRQHTELILPMVNDLLSEVGIKLNDLDAIAYGKGPGSFTGVRLAAGVTQGLAYSASLPVLAVSSLAALALPFLEQSNSIAVATDARMGEIYHAAYSNKHSHKELLQVKDILIKPQDLQLEHTLPWLAVGNGWKNYNEILSAKYPIIYEQSISTVFASAKHIIPLAVTQYESKQVLTAEQAVPLYLRNRVTH